ncbi:hypothetical protein BN85408580 [Alteracholeplasma palmae J233]|uniref:Uncharacterized protein n=1 Tax=Alteracholeplasma palmae (strain ATCC 49389 / J233) TaxID=1318466 RepID=U4KQ80_ALTPJ|nr:hypothetical protein [Alteracholeplasma palmae]CCV64435.1 hypothetical protein BN85408580 [Alteracholeplasma palmae J233]
MGTNSFIEVKNFKMGKLKWIFTGVLFSLMIFIVNSTMKSTAKRPLDPLDSSEKLVETLNKPKNGTPSEYSAFENYQIAAGIIYNATYFEAKTAGEVVANAPVIGNVTQKLESLRIKKYHQLYTELKSTGTVNAAEQKFISKSNDNVQVFYAKGDFNKNNVTWSDPSSLSMETYLNNYGAFPFEIGKYRINLKTILDQKMTKEKDHYILTFKIDVADVTEAGITSFNPSISSYYRELETVGDAVVESFNSLKVVLTIDENWLPISSQVEESYTVKKFGFSVLTKGNMTETYTDINADKPFPEYVDKYLELADKNETLPEYKEEKTASNYIMDVINSIMAKPIVFDANIKMNQITQDLSLGINIDTKEGLNFNLAAQIDNIGRFLYKNNQIYFKVDSNQSLNGYINQDSIKKLLDKFGVEISTETLDLNALLTDITENATLEKINNDINILLALRLGDKNININLQLNEQNATVTIKKIQITMDDIVEITLKVSDKEYQSLEFNISDLTNKDLYLEQLEKIYELIMFETVQFNGGFKVNSTDIKLFGQLNRNKELDVDLLVNDSLEINFSFRQNILYIRIGSMRISGTINQLKEILEIIKDYSEINIPEFTLNEEVLKEIVSVFNTLQIDSQTISIAIKDLIASLKFNNENNEYQFNLDFNNISGNINLVINEEIKLKEIDIDYIEINQFIPLIKNILPIIKNKQAHLELPELVLNVNNKELLISASLNIDFDKNIYQLELKYSNNKVKLTYENENIYLSLNDKLKLKTSKDELIHHLKKLTDLPELSDLIEKIDIKEILNQLVFKTNNDVLEITYDNIKLDIITTDNHIDLMNIHFKDIKIPKLRIDSNYTYQSIDITEYKEPDFLYSIFDDIKTILDSKTVYAKIELSIDGEIVKGMIYLDFNEGLKIDIEAYYKNQLFELMIRNKDIYFKTGHIKLRAHLDDLSEIVKELKTFIPNIDENQIKSMMNLDIDKIIEYITNIELTKESLSLNIETHMIKLIKTDTLNISYVGKVDLLNINGNLSLITNEEIKLKVINSEEFNQLKDLTNKLDEVKNFLKQLEENKEVTIYLDGILNVAGVSDYLEFNKIKGFINIKKTDDSTSDKYTVYMSFDEIFGQKITVHYMTDGFIYISINDGIKLKVELSQLESIIKEINSYLPEGLAPIPEINLNEITDSIRNTEIDFIKLINSIMKLNWTNEWLALNLEQNSIKTNIMMLLYNLEAVNLSGNLKYINNNQKEVFRLDFESLIISLNKNNISNNINTEDYINIEELMEFIPAIINTLDYSYYGIEINTRLLNNQTKESLYIVGRTEVLPTTKISEVSFPELYLELFIDTKLINDVKNAQHRIKVLIRKNNNDTIISVNYNDMKIEIGYEKALQIVDTILKILDLRIPPIQNLLKNIDSYEPIDTKAFEKMEFASLNELRDKVNTFFENNNETSNYQEMIKNVLTTSLDRILKTTVLEYSNGQVIFKIENDVLTKEGNGQAIITISKAKEQYKDRLFSLNIDNLNISNTIINANVILDSVNGNIDKRKNQEDFKDSMNFDTIYDFLRSTSKLATLSDYHIHGNIKVNMKVIGIPLNWSIPLELHMKVLDGKVELYGTLLGIPVVTGVNNDVPYKVGDTGPGHDRNLYFYYSQGTLYLHRKEKVSRFLQKDRDYEKKTKVTLEEFNNNPYQIIKWIVGFSDTIMNAIQDAFQKPREVPYVPEKILTNYQYDNKSTTLTLDMGVISGNKDLKKMDLTLSAINNTNNKYYNYLYQAKFNLNINVSVLNMDLGTDNLEVYDMGKPVDLKPLKDYIAKN